VAAADQFLRIELAGTHFLLPSDSSVAIESRDALILNSANGPVCAWRDHQGVRWPVLHLDDNLDPATGDDWSSAVFLAARPHPVGLAARVVQPIARGEIVAEPYRPLGRPTTPAGHLFSAVWVHGAAATLVFEPRALAAYITQFGGAR
jgi:hypothetical protein